MMQPRSNPEPENVRWSLVTQRSEISATVQARFYQSLVLVEVRAPQNREHPRCSSAATETANSPPNGKVTGPNTPRGEQVAKRVPPVQPKREPIHHQRQQRHSACQQEQEKTGWLTKLGALLHRQA
eukprot:TRINITY_DN2825_c0_g1_i13.p1 TRINITY_DN2825_c0_g1~~TRINITY_DN2825_c0_g1_i13.p1  ORF type:complete len:126 (-),score=2.96 TRINITY_DN2825_c0_g1_i13:176-553(-)